MLIRRVSIQGLTAGATAGVLAQVLVIRLNPEIPLSPATMIPATLLWLSWGALCAGLPLSAVTAIGLRRRYREGREIPWIAQYLQALTYLVAAVSSRINADLHLVFLSGRGHRTLGQDAVTWVAGALLAAALGSAASRFFRSKLIPWLVAALFVLLPLARLAGQQVTPRRDIAVPARALGSTVRPLLVLGVEGLDSKVLLTHAVGNRCPILTRIGEAGAWGPLAPYRPYLRRSQWTTTAIGAYPRDHGVKSRWGWYFPQISKRPVRLLPAESPWILPWGLARRDLPPPARLPALWERLSASGVPTVVLGWPGIWRQEAAVVPGFTAEIVRDPALDLLETSLGSFPKHRDPILRAAEEDLRRLAAARQAIAGGARSLWIHLQSLAAVRRALEPLRPLDTRQREALALVLELLDEQLTVVLGASPQALVAVVSPSGLSPPDSWERLRRLLGAGDRWRTSARSCPEGVLMLMGEGVVAGKRFAPASLADVAPTLCYLLGLPVAQYMEGRVILEAVEPEYVVSHPLRVVD